MNKTVLLGLFDGLHRGHERAIREVLKRDGEKAVYTFNSKSLDTKGERGLLMTDPCKAKSFSERGIKVISVDFAAVRDMLPEEFAERVLFKELSATAIVCGENFRFGRGGRAGPEELKSLCKAYGISVTVVPLEEEGGEPISTTRIRQLILSGDISAANRLLGYPYRLEVRKTGERLCPDPTLALPKAGRYKARLAGAQVDITLENGEEAVIYISPKKSFKPGESLEIELLNQIDI